MGNPVIFSGRRSKLLTADPFLKSNGQIIDYDGQIDFMLNGHAEVNTNGWTTNADIMILTSTDTVGEIVNVRIAASGTGVTPPYTGQPLYYTGTTPSGGLTLNTVYYVSGAVAGSGTTVDPWAFQVSATQGGSAVNLTSNAGANLSYFRPYLPLSAGAMTTPVITPTVTWTRDSAAAMVGQYGFRFTKDAANRLGEAAGFDFTIPQAYRAQRVSIQFLQSPSANFVTGDLTCYVYDVTNNKVIQPEGFQIVQQAGPSPAQNITFQTASNSTSYRLIFFVSSINASAYTVDFDQIKIVPVVPASGFAVNAVVFTSTTPSISSTTKVPFNSVEEDTSGAFDAANNRYNVKVPGPYRFSGALNYGASGALLTASVYLYKNGVLHREFRLGVPSGATFGIPYNFQDTANYGDYYEIFANNSTASTLAAGSSLNIVREQDGVSSDSVASRVVAFRAAGGNPASAAGGAPIIFPTVTYDTHGAYNSTTGRYTAPVPGFYRVHGCISSGATATGLNVYVDGVNNVNAGFTDSNGEATYSATVQANAGQLIDLRPGATMDADASSTLHIEQIQGPSQIQAATTVAAKYVNTAGTSISNSGDVSFPFATKSWDTTSSFVTDTFTAPSQGYYRICVNALFQNASYSVGDVALISVYKNGSVDTYGPEWVAQTTASIPCSLNFASTISCNANDALQIRIRNSRTGGATSLNTTAGINYVTIDKNNSVN